RDRVWEDVVSQAVGMDKSPPRLSDVGRAQLRGGLHLFRVRRLASAQRQHPGLGLAGAAAAARAARAPRRRRARRGRASRRRRLSIIEALATGPRAGTGRDLAVVWNVGAAGRASATGVSFCLWQLLRWLPPAAGLVLRFPGPAVSRPTAPSD
ncbi:unnamed protein product, partial [Prorocentrum cordatum]